MRFKNRRGWGMMLGMLVIFAGSPSARSDAPNNIVFDSRDKVNLLNANNVQITAIQTSFVNTGSPTANDLVGTFEHNYQWDGGINPPNGTNAITINFNATRNIRRVEMLSTTPGYLISNAVVETSMDGITWTPQSHTLNRPDGSLATITLDAAIDARYLRIAGTTYDQAQKRWLLNSLRVFGDPGQLSAGTSLDVVSRSAFTGGVTLQLDGTTFTTTVNTNQFVDDAYGPLTRQVMYSMGAGDGFTLRFDRDITFRQFGFMAVGATYIDTNATWAVDVSTNGVDWINVLTRAGLKTKLNLYNLPVEETGDHLRFRFLSTSMTDNRFSDIFAFAAPEPSVAMLAGIAAVLIRRRRPVHG